MNQTTGKSSLTVPLYALAIVVIVGLAVYFASLGLTLIWSGVAQSETNGLVILVVTTIVAATALLETATRLKAIRAKAKG